MSAQTTARRPRRKTGLVPSDERKAFKKDLLARIRRDVGGDLNRLWDEYLWGDLSRALMSACWLMHEFQRGRHDTESMARHWRGIADANGRRREELILARQRGESFVEKISLRPKRCPICREPSTLDEASKAYACLGCDVWLERPCPDLACEHGCAAQRGRRPTEALAKQGVS